MTIFSSCTKKAASSSQFKFTMETRSLELSTSGGIYLELVEKNLLKTTYQKLDATNSTDIIFGTYDIIAVAFAGPENRSGAVTCGYLANQKFETSDITIKIPMKISYCSEEKFVKAIFEIKKGMKGIWDHSHWDNSTWGI